MRRLDGGVVEHLARISEIRAQSCCPPTVRRCYMFPAPYGFESK